jgi:hypothetical protein
MGQEVANALSCAVLRLTPFDLILELFVSNREHMVHQVDLYFIGRHIFLRGSVSSTVRAVTVNV